MLSATFKQVLRELTEWVRRAEDSLLALGAERRCARRLDHLAGRLHEMGGKIDGLRTRLAGNRIEEPVDADFSLREALKGLKEDIREIRLQLAAMQRDYRSARLQRAFMHLGATAEQTYARADKLQWEIAAHDERWRDAKFT